MLSLKSCILDLFESLKLSKRGLKMVHKPRI